MAQYTIELRDVVKRHNIFDFKYDFYKDSRRAEFEEKFIRHFYFREIGTETVDRFKHYLEDKMLTVFPYYNKLMETTEVEYSILDNYDLTETTTIERANEGKSASISSTRGETYDEQQTDTEDSRNTENVGNNKVDETKTHSLNETSDTNKSTDNTSHETSSENKNTLKRFLDTPQGAVDLKDSSYLTTLNDDNENNKSSRAHDTTSNENSDTALNREGNESNSTEQKSNTSETSDGETHTVATGKQRGLTDNNTRAYSDNKFNEVMEVKRRGNIGVDADADMIQKHIKLQKILANIERMFFDECEDLFMLVF